jgi:DNA modification methylase
VRPGDTGTARVRPWYSDEQASLYQGHVMDVLPALPGESVHAVVTSPPYYGLRDYGTAQWSGGDPDCAHQITGHRAKQESCRRCGACCTDQQIGLEASPAEYVQAITSVFAAIRCVLRPDGTVWLNLGDCYYNGRAPGPRSTDPLQAARRGWPRPLDCPGQDWAKPKDLLGIPWQVALALQADGWWLRSAIVWHKLSTTPESVRDRPSSRYELIFLLTRSARYWFDLDAIRQPHKDTSLRRAQPHRADPGRSWRQGEPNRGVSPPHTFRREQMTHPGGANPGNVWAIPASSFRGAHFATFPEELARRCILAGCPEGGTVLDPFAGAGTTILAARRLGRYGIGIDLSRHYLEIAWMRVTGQPCTPHPGPNPHNLADTPRPPRDLGHRPEERPSREPPACRRQPRRQELRRPSAADQPGLLICPPATPTADSLAEPSACVPERQSAATARGNRIAVDTRAAPSAAPPEMGHVPLTASHDDGRI